MNKAIKEIRGQDTAELRAQLVDLRKEQFELRFHGTGEGSATARSGQIRRTIARIKTVLTDREQQASAGKAGDKQ